jgi:hypothetical protein
METKRNRNSGFLDEKMKLNKIRFIYLIAGITISIIVIVLSFWGWSNYSSKVILSGPFKISIQNIAKSKKKNLNFFGFSPYSKLQILEDKNDNNWECSSHSSFKNLYVYSQDSSLEIKSIIVVSGKRQIEIQGLHIVIANKPFELSPYLKGFNSKLNVLTSVFYWEEFKFLILGLAALLFMLAFIILRFAKNVTASMKRFFLISFIISSLAYCAFYFYSGVFKTDSGLFLIILLLIPVFGVAHFSSQFKYSKEKRNLRIKLVWKVIFFCFFTLGFVVHLIFYLRTGSAIITAGLFLYFFLFFTIFLFFVFLSRFSQKVKQRIKEIQLALIVITICLCLIESIFSIKYYTQDTWKLSQYGSPYFPEEKNGYHVWSKDHDLKVKEFCYYRTINSEGFSDTEHSLIKTSNEFRIIGLGDSFTEGFGADSDSTWMKFLERIIHKYPLQKQITFINAGVSGSDPFFEFILLKERLLKYKPDIVLLVLNLTDITDVAVRGGMERFQPDGTLKFNNPPWWEPVYAMSNLSRLFFSAIGYDANLLTRSQRLEGESKIKGIISTFDSLCNKNKCKLVVIFHPDKEEISLQKMQLDNIYQFVKAKGKPEVLNMMEYFTKNQNITSSNVSKYYWVYDMHNNAKGYEVFAKGVEWKLKQMGIIDSLTKK